MKPSLPTAAVLLLAVGTAWAHDNDGVPSRDELVDELRGINSQLRGAQLRLGDNQALDKTSALQEISRAQAAFFEEDYPLAAIRLLRLVARPGMDRHPGYPEALSWLGEALWAMDMRRGALRHFHEALRHPRQTPSAYRRMLARYLSVAGEVEQLDEVRGFWRRYQTLRGNGPLEKGDREARYHYAKALYRGGALAECEALFGAVDEDDPFYLRARYFLGVVRLSREDVKGARAAFQATLEAYQRKLRPEPEGDRDYLPDNYDHSGPARERVKLELEDDEILPPEEVVDLERMGSVIHLALARLEASEGNSFRAWQHYRSIPRGSADFTDALWEASQALFRHAGTLNTDQNIDTDGDRRVDASERQLGYRRAARLVDQLLSGRGDDSFGARLQLWKAQIFAKATDYDHARLTYRQLDAALERRAEQLEAAIAAEKSRLFPAAVLAWTAPTDANRARLLEADLVTQREALTETMELLALLEELMNSAELLPAVASAQILKQKLSERLVGFNRRLEKARVAAHANVKDGGLHNGGPPASVADVERIAQSSRRLYQRLERFGSDLSLYERNFRGRLRKTLAAEAPAVKRLVAELNREHRATERLATAMRNGARAHLEQTQAEALFGQVDLAYWRKEEISERILDVLRRQREIDTAAKRVEVEMEDPPVRVPVAPADAEGETEPAAEPEPAAADDEPVARR